MKKIKLLFFTTKNKFNRWLNFGPLILCAYLIAPSISYAAPVTYQFDGVFDNIVAVASGGAFDGNPTAVVGSAVTYTFAFDDAIAANGVSSTNAVWLNLGSMTIDFGGYTTTITPGSGSSSNNNTTVGMGKNSYAEIIDWFDGNISTVTSTASITTAHYQLKLADRSSTSLINTLGIMPTTIDVTLLGLGLYYDPFYNGQTSYFSVDYRGDDGFFAEGHFTSSGTVTAEAPVPEPATMLLLGSGLICLAGFRRKFRKSCL